MNKLDHFLYIKIDDVLKQIFFKYRQYKFKLLNYEKLNSINLNINEKTHKKIIEFVELIDNALNSINEEEKKILVASYINHTHYSKLPFSQSAYYSKRRNALYNFCSLLINLDDLSYLENFNLRINEIS